MRSFIKERTCGFILGVPMVCCEEVNVVAAAPKCDFDTSGFCPYKKEKTQLTCGKRTDSEAIRIHGGAFKRQRIQFRTNLLHLIAQVRMPLQVCGPGWPPCGILMRLES